MPNNSRKTLMNYSYIIIDDNQENVVKTKAITAGFSELHFVDSATNYHDGLHLILEHLPQLVFLEIEPINLDSKLSLALINELYRYLKIIPKIIVTTAKKDLAYEAIKYEVFDYLLKPLIRIDVIKLVLKLNKSIIPQEIIAKKSLAFEKEPTVVIQPQIPKQDQSLILCIKSYGDYRYIAAKDICYLHADNNSTDIHLNTGEMITAFKTLKHFEGVLSVPFIRIHNSYIVNKDYISRIHSGNSLCYIKNSAVKIPFSKTYKFNIELIISNFSKGNYLEI